MAMPPLTGEADSSLPRASRFCIDEYIWPRSLSLPHDSLSGQRSGLAASLVHAPACLKHFVAQPGSLKLTRCLMGLWPSRRWREARFRGRASANFRSEVGPPNVSQECEHIPQLSFKSQAPKGTKSSAEPVPEDS
jgi:hypothetical protein